MTLSKNKLRLICETIFKLNNEEPLDTDEIEQITNELICFNGED